MYCLRPIVIPSRQSSSSALSREQRKRQGTSGAPCTGPSFMGYQSTETGSNDLLPKSNIGFSQRMPSPETISLEPSSYQSIRISVDDLEIESPSSEISYVGHDPDSATRIQEKYSLQEQEQEDVDILGSYVIEIASDRREEIDEAVAVDDAIAWAKEKSRSRKSDDFSMGEYHLHQQQNVQGICMEKEITSEPREKIDEGTQVVIECQDQLRRGFEMTQFLMDKISEEFKRREANEETKQSNKDMALELLAEDIKNWSTGKEGNIRSLLATLQYILWPDSGWHAIPLTNMIETSHVRKAYQKARLCLHPDKLQQKGATTPQKYKAEKVFTILQDAWAKFNSHDVFSG